jgi:hypothetical protein
MNEKEIAEYRLKHTVKDYGWCLELNSLKSAIVLSYPMAITMYKDRLFIEGKPLLSFE